MKKKEIDSWYSEKLPRSGPAPTKWYLVFKTVDGWFYRYEAQCKDEPFVFKNKQRPDGSISDDDVTPQSIKWYFEKSSEFELVNEKIIFRGEWRDNRGYQSNIGKFR